MSLDKDNTLNNAPQPFNDDSANKSDLKNVFSEHENEEMIEEEYEALLKNIESIVISSFLRKEFYENLPDWSNPEIDNICNHSASDVEKRVKNWKWILFMNPCITQTLYFVNKLKKEFPHLSEKMELSVEILRLTKLNINSVHTFIQIRMPNSEPIIIDFAHDNDVYIYQWPYTNKSSHAIKTESTHSIPVNSFNENDTIFDIALKGHMLSEWEFDPNSQELHNNFFSWILNSRKEQLKAHNTKARFDKWRKKNKEVRVFNLLRS